MPGKSIFVPLNQGGKLVQIDHDTLPSDPAKVVALFQENGVPIKHWVKLAVSARNFSFRFSSCTTNKVTTLPSSRSSRLQ